MEGLRSAFFWEPEFVNKLLENLRELLGERALT